MEGFQCRGGGEEWGARYRKQMHKWQVENRQGEGNNSIGNKRQRTYMCNTWT